jgi:hypothetical protein
VDRVESAILFSLESESRSKIDFHFSTLGDLVKVKLNMMNCKQEANYSPVVSLISKKEVNGLPSETRPYRISRGTPLSPSSA